MSAFLDWIADHWLSSSVIVLAALAITYVSVKHKSLFYKE